MLLRPFILSLPRGETPPFGRLLRMKQHLGFGRKAFILRSRP